MHDILYIDRYPDLFVNVHKLILEFNNVKNLLEDVVNHNNKTLVQRKFHLTKYNVADDVLSTLPYTSEIAKLLRTTLDYNSITYRSIEPNTCYNWHTDSGKICYHIPLITNIGCWFVYENRCFSMPADGSVYIVNNSRPHTFINSGSEPRIHLTFEILD